MLLSELLEARVVDEDGESLGRVHDVRVRRLQRSSPDGYQLRVTGLVTGKRGVRERLGLDTARSREPLAGRDVIEWERVVSVDGDAGVVVVRSGS